MNQIFQETIPMFSQRSLLLEVLKTERNVSKENLHLLASHDTIVTYICRLRKEGYRIKYLDGKYYYGGKANI